MKKKEFQVWVEEIKEKLPVFLSQMQGEKEKGFYRYSYSGDFYGEKFNWGLGNSVFALKIYYSLNMIPENLNEITAFIQKFQKKNGEFYDPLVKYTSLPLNIYFALKEWDKNRIDHKFIRRAETRQTFSAFKLFDKQPKYVFNDFPQTKSEIKTFLESLNWNMPWGAGSHFSALMFLLATSNLENKIELITFATDYLNKYQQKDGCWYTGSPDLSLKINGAMKVITGLKSTATFAEINEGEVLFEKAKNLVDTALLATNEKHACSNFNLTYVLRYTNELLKSNYRYKEIELFIEQRLDIYRQFYHKDFGAFSFYKNKTNTNYYGAYVSKGKNEPDIHGTVLFLWGLAVIGNFWNINKEISLKEFVT